MKEVVNRIAGWKNYIIVAIVALVIGGLLTVYISYQIMPISATKVDRVFADINHDGQEDLIVSGYVIFNSDGVVANNNTPLP